MTSYVTSGEEAESDDDVNQSLSFMKNTMVTSTMVSGEASETDEEDDDDDTADQQVNQDKQSTPPAEPYGDAIPMMIDSFEIDDTLDSKHGKGRRQKLVFKYDSPLHRKLRERNLQMRSSLVEGSMQIYTSGSDKLLSSTYYLTKAQAAVEDVAFQSKVILEDLGSLDNALQDIRDLRFLPTLTSTRHTS